MACWLWGTPHSPDWAGLPCHPLSLPPEPPSSPPASSATPRHYSQQCRQQPSMLHAHLSGLHHDPACEDRCQPVHTGTLSSGRGPWGLPKHKARGGSPALPRPGCGVLGRAHPLSDPQRPWRCPGGSFVQDHGKLLARGLSPCSRSDKCSFNEKKETGGLDPCLQDSGGPGSQVPGPRADSPRGALPHPTPSFLSSLRWMGAGCCP